MTMNPNLKTFLQQNPIQNSRKLALMQAAQLPGCYPSSAAFFTYEGEHLGTGRVYADNDHFVVQDSLVNPTFKLELDSKEIHSHLAKQILLRQDAMYNLWRME